MKLFLFSLSVLTGAFLITGCVSNPKATSPLAQARSSVFLKKGITTQDQVLQKLGAPNIITTDSNDREVWTYQQHSISGVSANANIDATANTYGYNSFFNHSTLTGGLGGSSFSESSKTLTLTIKFNRSNIVEEYKSIYTSF